MMNVSNLALLTCLVVSAVMADPGPELEVCPVYTRPIDPKNVTFNNCPGVPCVIKHDFDDISGQFIIVTPDDIDVNQVFFRTSANGENVDASGQDLSPEVYDEDGNLSATPLSRSTVYIIKFRTLLTGKLPKNESGFIILFMAINDAEGTDGWCVDQDILVK